jgi:thioredoxin reductase/bacterioferritin-associated ferredoxin
MAVRAVDIAIVGAGPAGMAAAVEAAGLGLEVLVLDENPAPGGQIYRSIEEVAGRGGAVWDLLGDSYRDGLALAETFRQCGAAFETGAVVWQVDDDGTLAYSRDGVAGTVRAKRVIVATGAMERAVPIPGWTLPGVMGAGAAQNLLKSAAIIPEGKVVLAGNGPLLLLAALQLVEAAPLLPGALRWAGELKRGLAMRSALRRHGVKLIGGVRLHAAEGDGKVERLRYAKGHVETDMPADALLLHEGVVPNVQIPRQMRCDHGWYAPQRYWRPVTDDWGATSVDVLAVAGDGGVIFGAKSAAAGGRLAAFDTARRLGVIDDSKRNALADAAWREKHRNDTLRPFLDRLFRPKQHCPHEDAAIVCRCEEVTAGEIRDCVAKGAMGPNQMKAFLRCGMGPCQGRLCGLSVVETIAEARGMTPEQVGYYRIRPPIKPVTLGELAALGD